MWFNKYGSGLICFCTTFFCHILIAYLCKGGTFKRPKYSHSENMSPYSGNISPHSGSMWPHSKHIYSHSGGTAFPATQVKESTICTHMVLSGWGYKCMRIRGGKLVPPELLYHSVLSLSRLPLALVMLQAVGIFLPRSH